MFRNSNSKSNAQAARPNRGRFSIKKRQNKPATAAASSSSSHPTAANNSENQTPFTPYVEKPAATIAGNHQHVDGFSSAEILDLKHVFSLFDTEGNGKILVTEFRTILESLTQNSGGVGGDLRQYPYLPGLLEMLQTFNGKDDVLSLDDFLGLMKDTTLTKRLQEEGEGGNQFRHVFKLYDVEQKGYISIHDLERVALELGEYDMTYAELEEMMERAHSKENGKVTLEEFTTIMSRHIFRQNRAGREVSVDNA